MPATAVIPAPIVHANIISGERCSGQRTAYHRRVTEFVQLRSKWTEMS